MNLLELQALHDEMEKQSGVGGLVGSITRKFLYRNPVQRASRGLSLAEKKWRQKSKGIISNSSSLPFGQLKQLRRQIVSPAQSSLNLAKSQQPQKPGIIRKILLGGPNKERIVQEKVNDQVKARIEQSMNKRRGAAIAQGLKPSVVKKPSQRVIKRYSDIISPQIRRSTSGFESYRKTNLNKPLKSLSESLLLSGAIGSGGTAYAATRPSNSSPRY